MTRAVPNGEHVRSGEMLYLIDTWVFCTSETKEHQACRDGWVVIEGPTVRRTNAHRWRGSFSQGFGIGVWRRGSGCILRAGRPTLAIRTGRMKRTLQVVIVRAANTRMVIAASCDLTIFPWARVQRYCTICTGKD